MQDKLKDVATCELVDELKRREGVSTTEVEFDKHATLEVDGAAIVLTVFD